MSDQGWSNVLAVLALLITALSGPVLAQGAEQGLQAGEGVRQPPGNWPFTWLDEDGDCQDTETEVLLRDTVNLIQWADVNACEVRSGTWISIGTGRPVIGALAWVVPVVTPREAVASGATHWSSERQLAFINDFENLVVMDPKSAAQRDFSGPEDWLPAQAFRCDYVERWRNVKRRYGLSMDEAEQKAVEKELAACAASS